MATKVKIDLIFEHDLLPVYFDDKTKEDNNLSDFDYLDLMEVINSKNEDEFEIKLVSIDLGLSRVAVFSELFYSETQIVKTWEISEFTSPQQTIINDFIALL